jgi:hypothetical protein
MNMTFNIGHATRVAGTTAPLSPYEFGTGTDDVLELADVFMQEHLGQQALGRLLRDLVRERDALRAALAGRDS